MSCMNLIIKTRENKHLNQRERDHIATLRAEGRSLDFIAKLLGRNQGTISRELSRNKSDDGIYLPSVANEKYLERKSKALKGNRIRDDFAIEFIITNLKIRWSPEQIAGRLNLDHPTHYFCTETIYAWIYDPRTIAKYGDLRVYLPQRQSKRRKKEKGRKQKKSTIPNKISINDRPQEINERKIIGNWESDSIVSRESSTALNTLVERVTTLIFITKLNNKTAEETKRAQIIKLGALPLVLRKSVTADNGTEHTRHEEVTETIGTLFYFANPYHSWERGINENANGLVRRFFPKGTDFSKVTNKEIQRVEDLLNNRPRKRLGFRTPLEVFNELTKQARAA